MTLRSIVTHVPYTLGSIPVPKSYWNLKDSESGKEFTLEIHLDWQGILHLMASRALKNKSGRTNYFRGMIRAQLQPTAKGAAEK